MGDVRGGAYAPGVGVVALSFKGEVATSLGDGQWTILDSPIQVALFGAAPYSNGFLVGGSFGNFAQYVPRLGAFCPRTNPTVFEIHMIANLGRDVVVYGDRPAGSSASIVTVLERAP
jgi:hypothetical protein